MKSRTAVLSNAKAHVVTVADWTELRAGDPIEIVKDARTISRGLTEEVSPSGGVLWITSSEAEGQRQFVKSEGVLVRRA